MKKKKKFQSSYVADGIFGSVECDYTIQDGELPQIGMSPHPRPQHWYNVVSAARERDKGRCVFCDSYFNLQGHHRTYDHWGRELVEDVYTLCAGCHAEQHQKRRLSS